MHSNLRIGTCSWNYDSWVGLVYSSPKRTAAEYLKEYSLKFNTVEIDSWFYRVPSMKEVIDYQSAVDKDFRFTCKVSQEITLTHLREKTPDGNYAVNPYFLSVEKLEHFLSVIEPLLPQIDAIMFEFEYLNKQKMKSLDEFIDRLGAFFGKAPGGLPYAIEPRNKNYLTEDYFKFLNDTRLLHVFVETIYMPHIYLVYQENKEYLIGASVVRLLGGDRTEMEERSGKH